jgi:NAD(P)-dependent dehydrogenase (short-subunit alcohol dehydrogenase family)
MPASEAGAARRVALVTGGVKRVGLAIALELARAGFDLALHYRNSEAASAHAVRAVAASGARAHAFRADLADDAQCRALLPAVVAHFGRIDVLVNNASTFEFDDATTVDTAAMGRHWRANTAAPVLLTQALHAHLIAQARPHLQSSTETGCVVNLLDQKLWNPNPDHFSYTLSKAALQAATVMLAQACAPRLRVCAVAPGITLPSDAMDAELFAAAHRMTPLGKGPTPDDIARAVRFLVESPAITGSTIVVDAGQHLSGQRRDVLFLAQQVRS